MRKVLQIINSFHQGGSERQAVQITRLLCENGEFEVFLGCLNKEGVLREEIEKIGFKDIPEYKLTSFFNANFIQQAKKCAEFIRRHHIQIVHTHDFYTNVFGIFSAKLAGTELKIASKRETGSMRSKAQKFVEKLAFREANKIVVNAEAVKYYLINEGINESKISVIYNGLDLERLTAKETDKNRICAELGLSTDTNARFITLVANLRHTVKNQPMFLRAAQKVIQKNPNAHFILAGEGELKSNLEQLATDLSIARNTHFIGLCKNIPELLLISEICCLTSFNEGFSNSIIEYMSAGKPVVATNVGGAAEAVKDGETGFLVESDDYKNLAEKITYLMENQEVALSMGEKGKKFVRENFGFEAQLENTLKLYRAE